VKVGSQESFGMNTTERIVESYFRLCRDCFTYPDLKVFGGNNRQLDLLAYNILTGDQYHVETSVSHERSWRATWPKLKAKFDRKYFGAPQERDGPNTDHSRGKSYHSKIREAYTSVGFRVQHVKRIWVTWIVPESEDFAAQLKAYCRSKRIGKNPIRVMSFRDELLPDLLKAVGKSNYDDDTLRTLSLIRQFEKQSKQERERRRQRVFEV